MDSASVSFNMEDQKPIFTLAGDPNPTSTTDSFPFPDTRNVGAPEGVLSSMTPMMHEFMDLLAQYEPKVANPGYSSRSESGSSNIWPDNMQNPKNNEMMGDFDFLVKTLSSANHYLSKLTREQLSLLRSIRPSLVHEILQEVAKIRSDARMRRASPNECAFCMNNGENEEYYSSHVLKDWRGKVLCPVLRAIRCPRCGATGDSAHTIKYCPEGGEQGYSSRSESGSSNIWPDNMQNPKNNEMMGDFDFLVKTLSSANHYVSKLTREQLSLLRSIRPSLVHKFLQEVAKIRSDARMRRASPNECAFCMNNGENEEYYSSHVLKDWRGKVLCPVLRAIRCPRCGATGDSAHTIKYCPEGGEQALSSANHYVSKLTREQLSLLRSIRPSLVHEFLQEVAKIRSDARMRRASPNECAFCMNNGENEEYYSSHVLKDWRGKVLCPVLRAIRCPRCGATGDSAHTIKYCPEGGEQGTGGLASFRRAPRSQAGTSAPPASPVASPADPSLSYSSHGSNFGLNFNFLQLSKYFIDTLLTLMNY